MSGQCFPFRYADGTLVCIGDIVLDVSEHASIEMIFSPGTVAAHDYHCFATGGLLIKSASLGLQLRNYTDCSLKFITRGRNYELIQGLRSLAEELKPFAQEIKGDSDIWNGTSNVHAAPRQVDPYALMWLGVLTTIAEFLETHESQSREETLLQYKLFQGEDSFNNYSIDVSRFGDAAKTANQRMREKRDILSEVFINWIRNSPRDTGQGGGPL